MYVSQWLTEEGVPITPPQFTSWLACTANAMYARGWDVIGSFCKTPNLRPWKLSAREQLHQWAQEDIAQGRSNSLNLRLRDSGVIALDCDFHDASLMDKFVTDLSSLLGIRRKYFYTCQGAKGGKLFFRYSSRGVNDIPPKRLGPVAYSAGFAGSDIAKQELEIKTDLSTVAGLYGKVMLNDANGAQYPDAIVYSVYPGTSSILDARPNDLQPLTKRDLEAIETLYISILHQGHFVEKSGIEITPKLYEELTMAAVAAYLMRIAYKQQNGFDLDRFFADLSNDKTFITLIEPYYSYLNLDASLNIIRLMRSFFKSTEPLAPWQESLAKYAFTMLQQKSFNDLASHASAFLHITKGATERLKQEAQSKGLIQESLSLPPFELYCLLKQTTGGN